MKKYFKYLLVLSVLASPLAMAQNNPSMNSSTGTGCASLANTDWKAPSIVLTDNNNNQKNLVINKIHFDQVNNNNGMNNITGTYQYTFDGQSYNGTFGSNSNSNNANNSNMNNNTMNSNNMMNGSTTVSCDESGGNINKLSFSFDNNQTTVNATNQNNQANPGSLNIDASGISMNKNNITYTNRDTVSLQKQ